MRLATPFIGLVSWPRPLSQHCHWGVEFSSFTLTNWVSTWLRNSDTCKALIFKDFSNPSEQTIIEVFLGSNSFSWLMICFNTIRISWRLNTLLSNPLFLIKKDWSSENGLNSYFEFKIPLSVDSRLLFRDIFLFLQNKAIARPLYWTIPAA